MARRRGLGFSTNSKTELKAHVKSCGSHYFDRDTMRFFRSKLEKVIPGKGRSCFVTSEQFDDQRATAVCPYADTGMSKPSYSKPESARSVSTTGDVLDTMGVHACGSGFSGARRRRRR